jgi:hypothetical protein
MQSFSVRMPLILAAFGLTAAASPAAKSADPPAALKTLVDSCAAHKFETVVTTMTLEGRTKGSRVKICGKEGQTEAEWLVTLKDSVKKTESNVDLDESVRDQIVAALNAEIARLEGLAVAPVTTAPSATIALLHEPVSVPEAPPQYSSVPPLPAPLPRRISSAASAAGAPLVKPRLTISCALPHEAFAACGRLERETQLMIRAGEDLASGTSVRFLRGGDARAELDVGSLKKGASMRERLPGRVCAGVLRGKVQVQVLSKGRVADTLGPYALYCGS